MTQVFPRHSIIYPHSYVHVHGFSTVRLIRGQGLGTLTYPHENLLDEHASYDYDSTAAGYAYHQHNTQLLPTPRADVDLIPLAQDGIIAGGFHLEDRFSSTEPSCDEGFYDRGEQESSDSGGTRRPYQAATEYHPQPDRAQATGRGADALGYTFSSPPHPAGMVRNVETAQLPAESPPVETRRKGVQNPAKRKWAASPDEGRQGKRRRCEKLLHPEGGEQTQVSIVGINLTQN